MLDPELSEAEKTLPFSILNQKVVAFFDGGMKQVRGEAEPRMISAYVVLGKGAYSGVIWADFDVELRGHQMDLSRLLPEEITKGHIPAVRGIPRPSCRGP